MLFVRGSWGGVPCWLWISGSIFDDVEGSFRMIRDLGGFYLREDPSFLMVDFRIKFGAVGILKDAEGSFLIG